MSDEIKCWICGRTFEKAVEEFNQDIQADIEIDKKIKSRYVKGKSEFFPAEYDRFVAFRQASIERGEYVVTGGIVGRVHVWLCPVCSGLLESILEGVDELVENKISREDLEKVSIKINKGD